MSPGPRRPRSSSVAGRSPDGGGESPFRPLHRGRPMRRISKRAPPCASFHCRHHAAATSFSVAPCRMYRFAYCVFICLPPMAAPWAHVPGLTGKANCAFARGCVAAVAVSATPSCGRQDLILAAEGGVEPRVRPACVASCGALPLRSAPCLRSLRALPACAPARPPLPLTPLTGAPRWLKVRQKDHARPGGRGGYPSRVLRA